MFATFNMGVGMLLLVAPEAVEEVVARSGHEAFRIGEVSSPSGVHLDVTMSLRFVRAPS